MLLLKDTSAYQHSIGERLACEIYLARIEKGQPGSALDDWLKVEHESAWRWCLRRRSVNPVPTRVGDRACRAAGSSCVAPYTSSNTKRGQAPKPTGVVGGSTVSGSRCSSA